MGNESVLADNVVLEVASGEETVDIATQVQTGTTTQTTSNTTYCNPKAGAVDEAFNSPWKHNYYAGHYHNWWYTVGDTSTQGCDMQQQMDLNSIYWYDPLNKLLSVNLGINSLNTVNSLDNPDFDRIAPVAWPNSNSPLKPYNAQDFDFNVQGRSIYFTKKSNANEGYCFDIVDSYGGDTLLLKANGEDTVSSMASACPLLNQDGNSQELDWYVSAYQHMINWNTSQDTFTWTTEAESVVQSYQGNAGSGGYPQQISECFDNIGYLGLRSSYFHYDYTDYEVTINVGSLNNAKITVFDDSGGNHTISTTGAHTFCVDLHMSEHWGGNANISSGGVSVDGISPQFFDCFEGGITILEAQAVNNNSPASVTINDIQILKKETITTTNTVTIPTYSTVWIEKDMDEWNWLDVLESSGVPFSLNFAVGDLRDMAKRSTGYSKTFNIPASQHNNQILSPMLAVGNERNAVDIDKGNPYISWHKARVKVNGIYVFRGLMRVEEGNTGKGGFYKCHLIQDTIDWSLAIGKKSLCDIDLYDGAEPTEEKSMQNIIDSWDNSVDNGDFWFWGLVNYGEWYAQSINTGSGQDYAKTVNDFHPMVFTKPLVDKIFEDVGYTIESKFLNSDTFKKLCHPYSSGEKYFTAEGDVFGEDSSNACHVERMNYSTTYDQGTFCSHGIHYPCMTCSTVWAEWYPTDLQPGSDPGNNWTTNGSNGGYVVPFTGWYHIQYIGTLEADQGGFEKSCLGINVMKNGSKLFGSTIQPVSGGMNCYGCVAAWASGAHNGITINDDGDFFLNANDKISYRVFGGNANWLYHCYAKVDDLKMDIYPIQSATVPALPVQLNTNKILPCTKQIDFIKGITEMFNLQWTSDNEKKIVYCEPYDDFFGSGKIVDWSKKLDYESWNDKYIVEELAKKITYEYKEDTSDDIVDAVYRWREIHEQDVYKSHTEENDQKFRKEELTMGTKVFSSTIQFNSYGKQPTPSQNSDGHYNWGDLTWTNPDTSKDNPLMPIMWAEEGGSINRQNRPPYNSEPKFDLRILNYYGKADCHDWKFMNHSGGNQTMSQYPHLGWKDDWLTNIAEDPDSLHWGASGDGYNITSPGLFHKYWQNAYMKMNGGAALRTCMINLTPVDIAIFDYRDLVHIEIDGVPTYWTVNRIIDYKPNQTVLTKVELVEWKNKVNLKEQPMSLARQSDPGEDGENKMQTRATVKARREDPFRSSTEDKAKLSGDILEITTGTSSRKRNTALSVSETGEVQIHGGELAVEETDGIVHDLVYTSESGEIKKVYLKKDSSVNDKEVKKDSKY